MSQDIPIRSPHHFSLFLNIESLEKWLPLLQTLSHLSLVQVQVSFTFCHWFSKVHSLLLCPYLFMVLEI